MTQNNAKGNFQKNFLRRKEENRNQKSPKTFGDLKIENKYPTFLQQLKFKLLFYFKVVLEDDLQIFHVYFINRD